jgi:hypothetical protein
MKKVALIMLCITFCFINAKAQYKFPGIDASVMDMVYYPLDASSKSKPPQIRVLYSRPLKKGREVFGATGLQPYGKVWRLGANELTEIRFYVPVMIGGKKVAPGTYSLFAIPGMDAAHTDWTIILNGTLDKWGLFYDRDKYQDKDIVRFTVPVKALDNVQESLAITFTPLPDGANMIIGWDKTAVEVPITFTK